MTPAKYAAVWGALLIVQGCGDFGANPPEPANRLAGRPCAELPSACPDCLTAKPGQNSLTVVQQPAPVPGNLWQGWQGVTVDSATNGRVYRLEARWNLPNQTPRATVVMTVGGANGGFAREARGWAFSVAFQDSLKSVGVRCIDLRYVGGSDIYPRNGWPNIAAPYADAVTFLRALGVATAPLIGYGNSGGSNIVANALVNQGVPFDGVILGGGPFGVDFARNGCSGLEALDAYGFEDWPGGCAAAPDSVRACRSLLGPSSYVLLPSTDVAVLVGDADPRAFGAPGTPWPGIVPEAQQFLSGIRARSESFGRPAAPHQILATQAGARAMLDLILGWVP